jgi:glycine/D-amino acid oxidase-like deaminating enzyme
VIEPLPSYWFARSATREEADLVVVGAGLVGASTAWWGARAGRQVTVLEARGVAAEATGRSTGFLLTGGLQPLVRLAAQVGEERALRLWELSQENLGLLRRELLVPARLECGWRAEESWRTAAAGSAEASEWEASAERLARAGFAVDWRDAADVRRAAGGSELGGALHVEGDGGVDPVALCRGMLALAGVVVREGVAVRRLEPAGERVRLSWAGGEVLARSVVLAVNAHSGPLVPALAARLQPVGLQAFAAAATPRRLHGLWVVGADALSARQLPDGTAEPGFLELPTAAGQVALEEAMHRTFPALGRPAVVRRWAGTEAITSDGLPWVRSVPGVPAAAYACGFNGAGLSLGFALGRRLARWAGDRDESHLNVFQPVPAVV